MGDFKSQAFYAALAQAFRDYDELEDHITAHDYHRDFILAYLGHCLDKCRAVFLGPSAMNDFGTPDIGGDMTRAERCLNAIRHVQHHTAQLALRLQFIDGREIEWISRNLPAYT
jgi:hypothetical protein